MKLTKEQENELKDLIGYTAENARYKKWQDEGEQGATQAYDDIFDKLATIFPTLYKKYKKSAK